MPSPIASIRATVTVSFPEAIQAIIDGHHITKLEWDDPKCYGTLRRGFLMLSLHHPETEDPGEYQWHQWIITDGDLAGTDWIILP